MKLSKNFSLAELTRSTTATKQNIKEQFIPKSEIVENLSQLCENVLQPIRNEFGSFSPNSGYRCDALNKAVKGAKNSQHTKGKAADITIYKQGKNITGEVFFWLLENKSTVLWTKIILEYGNTFCPDWLHIEFVEEEQQQRKVLVKGAGPYLDYYTSSYYKSHQKENLIK